MLGWLYRELYKSLGGQLISHESSRKELANSFTTALFTNAKAREEGELAASHAHDAAVEKEMQDAWEVDKETASKSRPHVFVGDCWCSPSQGYTAAAHTAVAPTEGQVEP